VQSRIIRKAQEHWDAGLALDAGRLIYEPIPRIELTVDDLIPERMSAKEMGYLSEDSE